MHALTNHLFKHEQLSDHGCTLWRSCMHSSVHVFYLFFSLNSSNVCHPLNYMYILYVRLFLGDDTVLCNQEINNYCVIHCVSTFGCIIFNIRSKYQFFFAKRVTGKIFKSPHNHSFKSVEKVANGKATNPSKEPAPSDKPSHIKQ